MYFIKPARKHWAWFWHSVIIYQISSLIKQKFRTQETFSEIWYMMMKCHYIRKYLYIWNFESCWGKWAIFPQFCTNSSMLVQHALFCCSWNFACRVHIITSRQMKYETYWIFKSFLKESFTYCIPNLFFPFGYLPIVAGQSYFISYLFLLHDFNSDIMSLCHEQTKVAYLFSKEGPCLW